MRAVLSVGQARRSRVTRDARRILPPESRVWRVVEDAGGGLLPRWKLGSHHQCVGGFYRHSRGRKQLRVVFNVYGTLALGKS
jgi:hypothetical protein